MFFNGVNVAPRTDTLEITMGTEHKYADIQQPKCSTLSHLGYKGKRHLFWGVVFALGRDRGRPVLSLSKEANAKPKDCEVEACPERS